MPRYYFSLISDGRTFTDREGDELADVAAARRHALELAQDLMGTRSSTIRDWISCSLEVRDGSRRVLFILPFLEALDASRALARMPVTPPATRGTSPGSGSDTS